MKIVEICSPGEPSLTEYHTDPEQPTLRDCFAMQCPMTLAEFKSTFGVTSGSNEYIIQRYCIYRYQYADAMLKAREEKPNE
jgi:hypothetical protein